MPANDAPGFAVQKVRINEYMRDVVKFEGFCKQPMPNVYGQEVVPKSMYINDAEAAGLGPYSELYSVDSGIQKEDWSIWARFLMRCHMCEVCIVSIF